MLRIVVRQNEEFCSVDYSKMQNTFLHIFFLLERVNRFKTRTRATA